MPGKKIFYTVLLVFPVFLNCTLTEKSVTGQWLSNKDTLFLNSDYTFTLADRRDSYTTIDSMQSLDTGFVHSSGRWTVSKKTLFLHFVQDKKIVFGNCDQLWNWIRFLSKRKLVRPAHCYEPTNRFVLFRKIKTQ